MGRSSTGIKQSTIEEEDYSFDGEDDKTVKSYGKDPFAKSKAEMSPPTRQRATDAKGESGLKSMSPAKKVLFRDPTEEAESELNGKINKMNSDLGKSFCFFEFCTTPSDWRRRMVLAHFYFHNV